MTIGQREDDPVFDDPRAFDGEDEVEHTPTPWARGLISGAIYGPASQQEPLLMASLSMLESRRTAPATPLRSLTDEERANADFIVLAVNAHDDLVAACEAVRELLITAGLDSSSTNQWMQLRNEMWERLSIAIAKACGEASS